MFLSLCLPGTEAPSAPVEGTWARTCKECGGGMNLKLDKTDGMKCHCQQDSIRMNFPPSLERVNTFAGSSFALNSFIPLTNNSAMTNYLESSGQKATNSGLTFDVNSSKLTSTVSSYNAYAELPEPAPPLVPHPPNSLARSLNLPKRFQVDSNKLVASVYAKVGYSTSLTTKSSDKIVLRYTDGGIQKPEVPARISSKAFPKLVSRYISRKSSRDGLPMYIETYKQNSKLTVVTQSFM